MSAYRRPNRKLEGGKTLAVTGKAEIAFQGSKYGLFPTSEDKRTFRKLRAEFSGGEGGGRELEEMEWRIQGRTSLPSHERVHKRGEVINSCQIFSYFVYLFQYLCLQYLSTFSI